jgi:hypothetical protein
MKMVDLLFTILTSATKKKRFLGDFHLVDLQFPDVVDGGLQDGALVLTHVADDVVIPATGVEKKRVKNVAELVFTLSL